MKLISDNFNLLIDGVCFKDSGIIGVDGCAGVGKTTLCKELASTRCGAAVDIDDFLEKGTGQYVASVKYAKLAERLRSDLETYQLVYLSGVCLLQIMQKLGMTCDSHVYVAIKSKHGVKCNLEILDYAEGCEDALDSLNGLDREIARYHRDFAPHRVANIYYSITEQALA